jgi:hypothetical protein
MQAEYGRQGHETWINRIQTERIPSEASPASDNKLRDSLYHSEFLVIMKVEFTHKTYSEDYDKKLLYRHCFSTSPGNM